MVSQKHVRRYRPQDAQNLAFEAISWAALPTFSCECLFACERLGISRSWRENMSAIGASSRQKIALSGSMTCHQIESVGLMVILRVCHSRSHWVACCPSSFLSFLVNLPILQNRLDFGPNWLDFGRSPGISCGRTCPLSRCGTWRPPPGFG